MSLKAFHIVFVTLATLLAAGFAAWAFREPTGDHQWLGALAVLTAVILPIYGWWFLRKTKGVDLW